MKKIIATQVQNRSVLILNRYGNTNNTQRQPKFSSQI